MAQRRPSVDRRSNDWNKTWDKKTSKKSVASWKQERAKKNEADKWQLQLSGDDAVDAQRMLDVWERENIDIEVDEDTDLGDLMDLLNVCQDGLFDKNEKETLKMMKKNKRVAYPRQLGDWIEIKIDAATKSVRCNCERCNTWGKCELVVLFETIQFNKTPPAKCILVGESFSWSDQVKRATKAMKKMNIM